MNTCRDFEQGLETSMMPSESRPNFVDPNEIEHYAQSLESEMEPHILEGIKHVTDSKGIGIDLENELVRRASVWAVRSTRYNAVYFASRRSVQYDIDFISENAGLIDEIGALLEGSANDAIVNYALHNFVHGFSDPIAGRSVQTATKSVPRYAIQGYDQNTIVVKKGVLLDHRPGELTEEQLDWHDLSHILAAMSSRGRFGVKYHDGLDGLERYYRALTEGSGANDATGPLCSDGILFTQLSRPLFEHYTSLKGSNGEQLYNNDQVRKFIAEDLYEYLIGVKSLWHPGIESGVSIDEPINALALAVCMQNKRYERRAAELEIDILVRGTPDSARGDRSKDPLFGLSHSERLRFIAELNDTTLYFEDRNLIRHRAHEDALARCASALLQQKQMDLLAKPDDLASQEDASLLKAIIKFYYMDDLYSGYEANLYRIVEGITRNRLARSEI